MHALMSENSALRDASQPLQQEASELRQMLEQATQSLAHANATSLALDRQNKSMAAQIADLENRLHQAYQHSSLVSSASAAMQTTTSGTSSLTSELQATKMQLQESHELRSKLESRILTLESQQDSLREAARKTVEEHNFSLFDLHDRLSVAHNETASVRNSLDMRTSELAQASAQLEVLVETLSQRNARIGQLERALSDAQLMLTRSSDELESALLQSSGAASRVSELQSALHQASGANSEIMRQLQEAKALADGKSKEVAQLSRELSLLQDAKAMLESEVSNLRTAVTRSAAEEERLQRQISNLQASDQLVQSLQQQLSDLRHDSDARAHSFSDRLRQATSQMDSLSQQLDIQQKANVALSASLDHRAQNERALQQAADRARADLVEAQGVIESLSNKIAAKDQAIVRATSQETELRDTITKLTAEQKRLQSEVLQHQSHGQQLREALHANPVSQATDNPETLRLQTRAHDLEERNDILQSITTQHKSQIAEMSCQLQELHATIAQLIADKQSHLEALQHEQERSLGLSSTIYRLESANAQLRDDNRRQSTSIEQLTQRSALMTNQGRPDADTSALSALKERVAVLTRELESQKESFAAARTQYISQSNELLVKVEDLENREQQQVWQLSSCECGIPVSFARVKPSHSACFLLFDFDEKHDYCYFEDDSHNEYDSHHFMIYYFSCHSLADQYHHHYPLTSSVCHAPNGCFQVATGGATPQDRPRAGVGRARPAERDGPKARQRQFPRQRLWNELAGRKRCAVKASRRARCAD
jgi:chromosome segregation ATPase